MPLVLALVIGAASALFVLWINEFSRVEQPSAVREEWTCQVGDGPVPPGDYLFVFPAGSTEVCEATDDRRTAREAPVTWICVIDTTAVDPSRLVEVHLSVTDYLVRDTSFGCLYGFDDGTRVMLPRVSDSVDPRLPGVVPG